MPYKWFPPELFLEHDGVKIYHAYKKGHAMCAWYTTDPTEDDIENRCDFAFDVRVLAEQLGMVIKNNHKEVIIKAIDAALIDTP